MQWPIKVLREPRSSRSQLRPTKRLRRKPLLRGDVLKSLKTATFVFLGILLCVGSSRAAHNFGKLTGVVVDPGGNPQMGASVWLTPEFAGGRAFEILTDENGIFMGQRLRPGLYSVKVTL